MKINNETKIGILVVMTLLMLGWLTWKAGNYDFTVKGYELKVRFSDIDGVELNSPVTLNGLEVGRVKDIHILYGEETKIELSLWLKGHARIREGVVARVKNMGFMGEKYVGLSTPEGKGAFLSPGAVIIGQEPTNFEDILAQGEDIAKNIKEISEQLNERLRVNSEAIDEVVQNVRVSTKNIASISDNVNERLENNKVMLDEIVLNLNAASQNLEEMSFDLKENPWKLLYKPKRGRARDKKTSQE